MDERAEKSAGDGEAAKADGAGDTAVERLVNRWVGESIHLFLSVLSVLILSAAAVAAYDTAVTDFPKLFTREEEYDVLQKIIQNILLIAIAAELGLLLLYHRTSAAVEVIIFVIARKMVTPDVTSLDLLLSVAALAGLLVVRFYYLPGRPK
jgi:hypothetical protein